MKKKILFVLTLLLATTFVTLPGNSAYAARVPLTYDDPTYNQGNPQRSPIQIPEVDLTGYALMFFDSCVGCTLRIVNADDEVEYSTVITTDMLVLPSTLEGEYEIRIICGDHYFYGFIEL